MTDASVSIPVDGGDMGAYVSRPEQSNGGAVVVLQEIFGVNDTIRGFADKFSAAGFLAVAPDLFWRQERDVQINPGVPGGYERATGLMKGLDQGLALKDAQACVNWLAAQPEVTGKVGVVGFCLGGKLGFQLAGGSHVDSIVPYYGTGLHTVLESAAGFEGEALVHVAEADHLCPPEAQAAIASTFAENPRVTVMSYPGAGHAFARVGGDHYDEAAAERANAATLDFLHRRLSVENT